MTAKYRTGLGMVLMERGDYNAAIQEFNESARVQMGRPDLVSVLGTT